MRLALGPVVGWGTRVQGSEPGTPHTLPRTSTTWWGFETTC